MAGTERARPGTSERYRRQRHAEMMARGRACPLLARLAASTEGREALWTNKGWSDAQLLVECGFAEYRDDDDGGVYITDAGRAAAAGCVVKKKAVRAWLDSVLASPVDIGPKKSHRTQLLRWAVMSIRCAKVENSRFWWQLAWNYLAEREGIK
jgi:hypothetical protein